MINENQIDDVQRATVYDRSGDKVGKAGQVYLDDATGQPSWITVNTGLFGTSESFVPLDGASFDGGDRIAVAYEKSQIKDAPRVAADGHLEVSEEEELHRYYGLGGMSTGTEGTAGYAEGTTGTTTGTTTERTESRETVGHDTSGPTTDDAMTRSEERLDVGTERREAGRVRLRKHVVTEQETVTVPVSREEVRVEREPITDANRGEALSGPDVSEEEHEVVLTEERPVVSKETVPVERVRMGTETVTDEQQVTEDVRKEQIDVDAGTESTTRNRD